jgi:hypothetical protein
LSQTNLVPAAAAPFPDKHKVVAATKHAIMIQGWLFIKASSTSVSTIISSAP